MEPQQLVDTLSLTCRPRSGRDALLLAVQACVLRALGDRGVEIETGSGESSAEGTASAGASSLLSAFHPLPAAPGTYPTQRYRLPAPDDDGPRPIRLLLKPVALDIPGPAGEDGESPKQGSEPALILYGRAVVEEGSSSSTSSGQGDACIHSLALRVGEFLTPVEGGGAVAQAEGGVDSEGRVVVRIKGAGGGEGGAWWCRLGALGDRLAAHLLAKLLPPSFFPHQLPTLLAALPPPPPPPPANLPPNNDNNAPPPRSYNSPFPHLLAFLPAPHAVLSLASTCRDCAPLGKDPGAWTALLNRDFPDWRAPSSSGSTTTTTTTTTASPSTSTTPPAPASSSPPLAAYRRRWAEKRRKEGGRGGHAAAGRRGLFRPFFDGSTEGWRHLFSPYGPTARRPLPMTPGGVLLPPYFDRDPEYFEGGSGLGWPRRPLPRYLPFFAPPAPSGLGGWDDGWAWM